MTRAISASTAASAFPRQVLDHVERVALGEGAVGKRQPSQIAEHEIAALERFAGEVRRDVDAHDRRAALVIPDERSAAAAPEIDDHVAGRRLEEAPQHPLADAGLQQRRRHGLVARVGVQRLVEVLRLLGERRRRPQVQIARPRAARCPHDVHVERLAAVGERPAAVGTARQRQQRAEIMRRARAASSTDVEPFGARVPPVVGRVVERRARQPVEPRAIADDSAPIAPASRSRRPGLDQHRVHVVGQHFAQRGQIRRDDRAAGGEVLEQLQRRRVALGNRASACSAARARGARASSAATYGWRQPAGELDAVGDSTRARQRLEPRPVTLSGLPADDRARGRRAARASASMQDVHAFPRIQVTCVADRERRAGGGRLKRAARRGATPSATTAAFSRAPKRSVELAAMHARQRDVALGRAPHPRLAGRQRAQLRQRRRRAPAEQPRAARRSPPARSRAIRRRRRPHRPRRRSSHRRRAPRSRVNTTSAFATSRAPSAAAR